MREIDRQESRGRMCDSAQPVLIRRGGIEWKFREALDPVTGAGIALPPDPALAADLAAARWKFTARGIQVELKTEIIRRLGRSPDRGDAVIMAASIATPIA
jgi:hypothetical protein